MASCMVDCGRMLGQLKVKEMHMSIFYKPANAYVGDVIPFFDKGLFKPFYLKIWRDYSGKDRIDGWHMLTTSDHVHVTERPTGIEGGTGSVLEIDGLYHMFYCKFDFDYSPVKQMICHAVSKNLEVWEELPEETFTADGIIYELSDWRDPFVFWNEEAEEYWMLVSTQLCGRTMRKGCVGLCTSRDLKKWEYRPPFYAPGIHQSAHECADLFKMGDWYYLIYSAYTDRFQTYYRMSRSLNGPWITPEVDTFDTRAFYAAKTGTDGRNRYLYAWNPTREYNMWQFNAQQNRGKDYNTWDWGGSMVVHLLHQNADGTLGVSALPSVDELFAQPQPIEYDVLAGNWTLNKCTAGVVSPYSYSSILLNTIPDSCRLSLDFTFETPIRQFGVALQVGEAFSMGYYLCFEPARGRVQYKTGLRMYEDGGKMFPYEVEMERPLKLVPNKRHHLCLYIEDSILEVYIDNEVALSTRMFDYKHRRIGLFVSEGSANFENISIAVPTKTDVLY